MANGTTAADTPAAPNSTSTASSAAEEPEWLRLFCVRADVKEVAEAWLKSIDEDKRPETLEDKIIATRKLRAFILDSDKPEVRKDADSGFRYTGQVMRAADDMLKVARPKATPAFKAAPAAPSTGGYGAPAAAPAAPAAAGLGIPAVEVGQLPASASSPALKKSRQPKLILDGEGKPGSLVLWWSDFQGAADETFLKEKGITHRLSVAAEIVGRLPEVEGIETVHVPMPDVFDDRDDLHAQWVGQLKEALEIMLRWRERGAVVNVNCQMGKNRSGATLLVYLVTQCGWDLHEGVEQFRSINALACANPHLLMALGEVLGVDGRVELNKADGDGGGWVCISPPGSPRLGVEKESFEEMAEAAAAKLASDVAAKLADLHEEEEEDAGEDAAPLFSHLDDVD